MAEIKNPVTCPKCGCRDVCEIAEQVYQKHHYTYVGSKATTYKLTDDDSENFGDLGLECEKCGYAYSEDDYERWLDSNNP
jgi:hypothetical protein